MDQLLRDLIDGLRDAGVTEYEGPLGMQRVRLVLGAAPPRPVPAPVVDLPPSTVEAIREERERQAAARDVGFGVRMTPPGAYKP